MDGKKGGVHIYREIFLNLINKRDINIYYLMLYIANLYEYYKFVSIEKFVHAIFGHMQS